MSDDAKKKILARRSAFIAAALAGVACGKDPADRPRPCLSITQQQGQNPDPCLAVPLNYDPDAAMMTDDASAPPPQPCLSIRALEPDAGPPVPKPPPPQPCLSPMPPKPKP